MRSWFGGLGAPADFYVDGHANPKYVNVVLMADGTLRDAASLLTDPDFAGNKAEVQSHIAQRAWAFVQNMLQGSPGMYSVQYNWIGTAPSTGAINMTGGAADPNTGAIIPTGGVITPTGYTPTTPPGQPTYVPPIAPPLPAGPTPPSSGGPPVTNQNGPPMPSGGGIRDTAPAQPVSQPPVNGTTQPVQAPPYGAPMPDDLTMAQPAQASLLDGANVPLLLGAAAVAFLLTRGRK